MIFIQVYKNLTISPLNNKIINANAVRQPLPTPSEQIINKFEQNFKQFNNNNESTLNNDELLNEDICEVIHVGFVCSGSKSILYFHTLLKSIYFYRLNPIHFHIVVNKFTEKILNTLFTTWNVPKTKVTFYDINESILDVRWVPNSHYSGIFGLLKLVFPKIIPLEVTNKIIILDTDLIFTSDILELWKLFNKFTYKQAIGIVDNQSEYYLGKFSNVKPWPAIGKGFNSGVILYRLDLLKSWPQLWSELTRRIASQYGSTRLGDQDIINAVLRFHPDMLYQVPCHWNTQLSDRTLSHECYRRNRVKIIHWNSPKKTQVLNKDGDYFRSFYTSFLEFNGNLLRQQLHYCEDPEIPQPEVAADVCHEFQRGKTGKWRTILFFRDYQHTPTEGDVTFVAQLSYDRLQLVEELIRYWQGPISLTLYLTDPEFEQTQNYIENSETLQNRNDIAYHVVFKEGEYYPINMLRNVGLRNVNTAYVFLADIDFMPVKGLYSILKTYLTRAKRMKSKALIVPAFETQRYRTRLPKNKIQLLQMLDDKKIIYPFRADVWSAGHAPTNYTKWRSATSPYNVKWQPDFEPYIVVQSDVTEYDNRFMGFGWNKVSHIMELEAQGYEWVVLPNAFIIHKAHAPSYDIAKFRSSPTYRMCLQNLKDEFISDLDKKYGRLFENKNTSILSLNPNVT